MLDPGTSLAITSLAIEVTKGLLAYYGLWKNANDDIKNIQISILWLANLFTQLDITLHKQKLQGDVASVIRLTVKSCEDNILKLQAILDKIHNDGSPEELHRMFKATKQKVLYMFKSKAIKQLVEILQDLKDDLKLAIDLLDLNTSAEGLDELQSLQVKLSALKLAMDESTDQNNSVLERRRRTERRQQILEWLAPCNIAIPHHSAFEKREEGTGNWFLQGDQFHSWCATDGPFLWLHGDVGCGKTVLCASIIEEVMNNSKLKRKPDNLVYFYFAFDNTQLQSLWGFLKSALAQLCPSDGMLPQLKDLFQSCHPDLPSLKELQLVFLNILCELCKATPMKKAGLETAGAGEETCKLNHTFIVIDGLDEIPYGRQRQAVLGFLRYLSGLFLPRLHILVTSRLERDIETAFLGSFRWQASEISRQDVTADIDIYITKQIEESFKLQSQPETIKLAIREKLVAGADGMFRWSALQMEALKNKRVLRGREILKIISTLPLDLDATYERILTNIDASLIYEALAALKWLSCASRPIFIEELIEACIIRPDEPDPVEEDQRLSPFDILEILPGLVRIEPTPSKSETLCPRAYIVTLSHFSVKEYLFSDRIRRGPAEKFSINLGAAQYHIARSCLAYITYCHPLVSPHLKMPYPLHLYAHSRWPLHVALVPDSLIEEVSHIAIRLFRSPKVCLNWIESTASVRRMADEKNKPRWLGMPFHAYTNPEWHLHYLLCYSVTIGNKILARILLESGLQVHSFDGVGQPLTLAVCHGDTLIVHLLLQTGCHRSGALIAALRSGREDIVGILLEARVKIHGPELLVAAERSSLSIFQSLVAASSSLKITDVLKALGAAVRSLNYESAATLWEALIRRKLHLRLKRNWRYCGAHQRIDDDRPFFNLIVRKAITLDSPRTLLLVLRYMSKAMIDALDTEALFLTSVVQNRQNSTRVLSNYLWFPITEWARSFAKAWETLAVDSQASAAMVYLHKLYIFNGLYMPENSIPVNTNSSWVLLRALKSGVVPRYLQIWSTYQALTNSSDRQVVAIDCTNLSQHSNSFQKLQPAYRRLEVYMVLSGPYSSFLKDILAIQYLRQIALQSPQRVALRSISFPKIGGQFSNNYLSLNSLPWREFLNQSLGDEWYPLVYYSPPSSISAQSFDFELRGVQVMSVSKENHWWNFFMNSDSHESFHEHQLSYLTGSNYLVQDTLTPNNRAQMPHLESSIKRFAMHIEIRPSKEGRSELEACLQRDFSYHAVIHGIFDTMDMVDPNLDDIFWPCITVYEECMRIELLSESPKILSQWLVLADKSFTASNFRRIFPHDSRCLPWLEGKDDEAAESNLDIILCQPKVWVGPFPDHDYEDEDSIEVCVDFLKALLETQGDGWSFSWSQVKGNQGELPPPHSNIQLGNAELDTIAKCNALVKASSLDGNRGRYTQDGESSKAVSSSKGI
ncbi:hypothetical protein B0O99DRAFT_689076 [Bisporella sp. PMI_857]|nr:hypothetical protein B0O99DRAFT_689076 [Bisporella sp. PMI_857]